MDERTVAAFAEVVAAQARILGMQAENDFRKACGESPAYREQDFSSEAAGLSFLANHLNGR